jgi:hypothetical protein
MLSFSKQTTPAEEDAIERTAAKLREMGYGGDIIVYRNQADVALANLAALALNHDGTLTGKNRIMQATGEDQRFALIGAKTTEDGRALREKVAQLREMIAPAFGVAPEEQPKPPAAPPRKAFNP